MLTRMAVRKLQIKLLGTPAPKRPMSYSEFRNWDRIIRERPNR